MGVPALGGRTHIHNDLISEPLATGPTTSSSLTLLLLATGPEKDDADIRLFHVYDMNPRELFARLESRYGLPADYLKGAWQIESSSGKHMRNKSGAAGHFQFMPKTAEQYGLKNPDDLEESADAAARLARDGIKRLISSGQSVSSGNLYLLHQQGIGAGPALLKQPGRKALDVLTDIYKSAGRAAAAITQNGGNIGWTAGEFTNHIASQFYNKAGQQEPKPRAIRQPAPQDPEDRSVFQKLRHLPTMGREQYTELLNSLGKPDQAPPTRAAYRQTSDEDAAPTSGFGTALMSLFSR